MKKDGFEEAQEQLDVDFDNFTANGDEAGGRLQTSPPASWEWKTSSLEPVSTQLEMVEILGARPLCNHLVESNQSHNPRPKFIPALAA